MMIRITHLILLTLLFATTSNTFATSNFSTWGYQLQSYNLDALTFSDYDILVLDYSKDGSDDEIFASSEIDDIRTGKDGRKILSYISIGEAEDYRFYWNDDWLKTPPEWLDQENPDWDGNYKVKYWIAEWQDIIKGYLQKIIDTGFDGIYLDIIDAYEYYESTVANAEGLMINFMEVISNFTRGQVSEFLIIPQNGEAIVTDHYLELVDGIAREEVYVIATNDKRDLEETREIEGYLDQFKSAGKIVMVVDYANKNNLIEYATSSASAKGYLSLVTDVDLDYLGPNISKESESSLNLVGFTMLPFIGIFVRRTQKR